MTVIASFFMVWVERWRETSAGVPELGGPEDDCLNGKVFLLNPGTESLVTRGNDSRRDHSD